MEMLMEIDDVKQDQTKAILKNYLQGKINEIKQLSSATETQKCQENCLSILQKLDNYESADMQITNMWQRVHNDKLILGLHVDNTTQSPAENINIVLKSDTDKHLTYTTKLWTKYQPTETFDPDVQHFIECLGEDLAEKNIPMKDQLVPTSNFIIVIVLDVPQFVNFTSMNLEGVLVYEKKGKNFQIQMPKFCLTIEDITTEKYAITIRSILSGAEDAYLSMISASMHSHVKMIIPKGIYRTLDGLLQIDCFFTKAEVNSGELILVYDGNSQCLKDIVLKVSKQLKEPKVDIFTKNDKQLQLLYHHLYNKIPGLVILNKDSELCSVETKKSTESLIQFIASFRTVLQFAEENFQKCLEVEEKSNKLIKNINLNKLSDGYENFRRKLANLEKRADEDLKIAMEEK